MNYINAESVYLTHTFATIKFSVSSEGFSGQSNFCIQKIDLIQYEKALSKMHEKLDGECIISDYDSDTHIIFKSEPFGHVVISGQLGGTHQKQYLYFNLKTDQTVLNEIRSIFNKILNEMETI